LILFYAPDILTRPELPESESLHCIRVLRKKPGDEITITDGKGAFHKALISDAHPQRCKVNILGTQREPQLRNYRIEIAIAPTKNPDRMEWLVEKATETGVDAISLLKTVHSERKEMKTDRLRKVMIAAMKQSLKATLPELRETTGFDAFIRQAFAGQKLIAYCGPGEKPLLSRQYRKGENALILIGPEGDFHPEEIRSALEHGFQPVSLGDSRLRTETAALTACMTFHLLNQLP
jgi:16S rRNA (uracil1498-N3)-methyltransferase